MTKHIFLSAISLFTALAVNAQTTNTDTSAQKKNHKDLKMVTVRGAKSHNRQPVSIGKMDIQPMDLPQSVQVIDAEVIEQQQAQQLSDVLKNVNGVYLMGNTGGYQEEIAGRGFAFGSSNTFKNGVRFNNGIRPEVGALEKVEVMKGSSAILYGNVAAGGVLSLITKKPKFEKGGEVSMRAGSYDLYKPSFDIYGAVNNSRNVAYRLNSSFEKAGSFRDNVKSERFYINPSFLIKAGEKVDILLEGDYLQDTRTLDFGVGTINYELIDVPRERFLGVNWAYNKTSQASATATTTYHINDNWELKNITGYQDYNNDLFGNTRPNASNNFVQADGKWLRSLQRTQGDEQYMMTELDLSGKFNTGFLHHSVLVGMDVDQYDVITTAFNGVKYDSINVFDLNKYKQRTDIPTLSVNTVTGSPINRFGAYVQDLISITEKIKLLAGARYTYQQTKSDVNYYNAKTTILDSNKKTVYFDDAVTPRIGLVYQPTKKMSVFASYATSFILNTGIDITGSALPPSYTYQYEAGVKNDLFDGLLSANLTAYQIRYTNMAQISLENGNTNPNVKELAGEITSRGIEADVMSRPYHGFSVIAGYSYNETKYTESNTYIVGSLLRYNPQHTANASLYYSFSSKSALKGFNAGLGAFYFGDRMAGRSKRTNINGKSTITTVNGEEVVNDTYNLIPLPAFIQLDASAGYQYHDLSLRFKVSNLLNELSYFVHDDNSVNPIAPTMFMGTLSYKF